MADRWFRVQLDLERIRRSLSRADGRAYSTDHIRLWLRDAGFVPDDAGWVVREADLGQVDAAEVVAIEPHPGPPPP